MFISLQQLERNPVRFDVDVEPGQVDFDGKTTQVSPLHSVGVATLLNRSLGEIRVQGDLRVTVSAPCDRCVEPTNISIEKSFDLVYMPATEPVGAEDEIDEAGIEVGYYDGSGLTLNDMLREVVLLALPMQVVCRDECKGICPVCGQNRNAGDCGCQISTSDDRWSKLRNFRPKAV